MAFVMVAVMAIPGLAAVSFAAAPAIPDYTGTADVPHLITNKYELASIGNNVFGKEYPLDGNYLQTQDIVFTAADFAEGGDFYNEGKGWKPIGGSSSTQMFKGVYNGGGFAIENIYINRPEETYVGIFCRGTLQAKIVNAGNKNGNITGKVYVGGITGSGFNQIINCYNTGSVNGLETDTNATTSAGINGQGLLGADAIISGCYNTGKISSNHSSAGIIGSLNIAGQKIENCYNKGEILSSYNTGGIASDIKKDTTLKNCYNTGKISGNRSGGVVGLAAAGSKIELCFNTAEISGDEQAGGLAAYLNGTAINCYNTGNIKSEGTSGGIAGSTTLTGIVNDCYNRGKISGRYAGGISGGFSGEIHYCYNAGEVVGTERAGSILAAKVSSMSNNYYDAEVTKLNDTIQPGGQGGKGTTAQMTGINAVNGMSGLITRSQFVVNMNGYPELRAFRESDNPFIKDESSKSTQVGEIEKPDGGEDPDNPGGEDPENPGEGSSTASGEIIGTVHTSQIKAVVPTVITFEIYPDKTIDYTGNDGDDAFVSPSFSFGNASTIPINFVIDRISAKEGMPSVVENNKYTDEQWQALGRSDTNGNLAFGFKLDNSDQWQSTANVDSWYGNSAYTFGVLGANKEASLRLKGKYGLNWGNATAKRVTYDVVYKVEAQKD